jgi:hypothetical protein
MQSLSKFELARSQWLQPVILATLEAEIRKISVQSIPDPILKNPSQKRAGDWLKEKCRP